MAEATHTQTEGDPQTEGDAGTQERTDEPGLFGMLLRDLAVVFAALDGTQAEHRRLQLRSVRCMVVTVLFYAGLHKLL